MKRFAKVSKLEILHSLEDTIAKNEVALDCIVNWKNKVSDMLKYDDTQEDLQFDLEQLGYIEFCLRYLDDMYRKSYKQQGGKL